MSNSPLCVVGIGASAGGIEAFHRFFEKMPPDSGLAFVVVLHLAPGRKSMLPAILSRWTTMEVTEAADGEEIAANHVLVIPAGVVAQLKDGRVSLDKVMPQAPRGTALIDTLFDSMASSLNEDAVGIVLSGTGHDGALGLKAIKALGGLTLAQGKNSTGPEYPGMPDSAVAMGAVDLHVPVEEMPGHILAARALRLAELQDLGKPEPDVDAVRLTICDVLRSRLGHDFSQ